MIVALACLCTLALVPAAAHASRVIVNVKAQGTGAVSDCGFMTGDPNATASSTAEFVAIANAAQPNKSTFVGWSCTPAGPMCTGCDSGPKCSVVSPHSTGDDFVKVNAVFVDNTRPVLSGLVLTQNPTINREVSFSWKSDDAVVETECSINGAAFGACPPGNAYVLPEGTHFFAARATDPAGNVSLSTNALCFQIIDTALTGGPSGRSTEHAPVFSYTSGLGTRFECSLDGAPFTACPAGSDAVGPLADGAHTFSVRAYDDDGFRDLTPATREWIVDPVPVPTVCPRRFPPASRSRPSAGARGSRAWN